MLNYCASDFGDLKHRARRNLRSMQRRSTLVRAFWKHGGPGNRPAARDARAR
jgi:hypothetical protein